MLGRKVRNKNLRVVVSLKRFDVLKLPAKCDVFFGQVAKKGALKIYTFLWQSFHKKNQR